jgi:hypothetical protein
MRLFSHIRGSLEGRSTAQPPNEPIRPATVDWSDIENIRAEWKTLESVDASMLGWRNGMRMYDDGPVPTQRLNVAEYLTRALGHHLFGEYLLTDADAAETVRRVLTMVEMVPSLPADGQAKFALRLARLALAIVKRESWQPMSLGGDGQVNDQILRSDRHGLVWSSVRCPGISDEDAMRHFFAG